jgi:hypothetical protein
VDGEHAIADLICDLGKSAEERDLDFVAEIQRGIGHWYAEHHFHDTTISDGAAANRRELCWTSLPSGATKVAQSVKTQP